MGVRSVTQSNYATRLSLTDSLTEDREDNKGQGEAKAEDQIKAVSREQHCMRDQAMTRGNIEIVAELDNGNSDSQGRTKDFERYIRWEDLNHIGHL
ncbi:unnamed protein product, partial [Iphiclides podalirius]